MPIGAETIGTAYVRVLVDGKNFDLDELFDGSDGQMEKHGRKSSEAYREGFIDEMESAPSRKQMNDALRESLISGNAAKKFRESKDWHSFREGLIKEYGDVGRRAGENLEKEMRDGLDISNLLREVQQSMEIDGEDIDVTKLEGRLTRIRQDLARASQELTKEALTERQNEWQKHLDMLEAYSERERRMFAETARQASALREDETRARRDQLELQNLGAMQLAAYREDHIRTLSEAYFLDRQYNQKRMAMLSEAYWENSDREKKRRFAIQQTRKDNDDLLRAYRNVRRDIELMTKGEIKHGISVEATAAKLKQLSTSLNTAGLRTRQMEVDIKRHHDALLRMNPTLNRYRHNIEKIGDAVGTSFGRGSRNNFLNFTGSVARNVVRLGARLFNLGGYFTGLYRRMKDAGTVLGAFGVIGKDVGGLLLKTAGGLLGLFGVIGPLTSMLSLLAGTVLALASSMGGALLGVVSALGSTLALGLGGGLGILAAALVPAVAGLGTLIAGIANLDGAAKSKLNHIKKAFSGLGQAAAEGLTFDRRKYEDSHNHAVSSFAEVLGRVEGMVKDLRPIMVEVGRGVADALDIVTLRLTNANGAWSKFIRAMSGNEATGSLGPLAVQARLLGRIFGETFGGLLGMLRAVEPSTTNLLQWMRDLAVRFNNFANSANGQSELRAFFDRAAESAAALGGFLAALGGLFAEVIDQANRPGDRLFVSMTKGIEGWTEALDRNPDIMAGWIRSMESFGEFVGSTRDLLLELTSAGKDVGDSLFGSMSKQIDGWVRKLQANPDILKNWYDSAGAFARALGDVVVGLGKVFSALDNTFSRAFLTGTFEIIAHSIEGLASALETVARLLGSTGGAVERFAGQVAAAAFIFPKLTGALGAVGVTGFVANLKTAEGRMAKFGAVAKQVAGIGGLMALAGGLGSAAENGTNFGNVLSGVAGGAGLGMMFGPLGALIGGVAGGGLVALAGAFRDTGDAAEETRLAMMKASGFKEAAADADSLAESLAGVVAAYGETSRAAVEASFVGKDGKLDADVQKLRDLGVSMDTITSAALGQADAQKIVNDALGVGVSASEAAYEADKKRYEQALKTYGSNSEITDNFKREMEESKAAVEDLAAAEATFGDRVDANGDAIASHIEKVAALRKSLGLTVEQYRKIPREVRTRFEEDGLTQTTADSLRLIGRYKELQKFRNIKAIIKADGAQATIGDIRKLAKQYELTPKQIKTLVKMEGLDLTRRQIRILTGELDKVDKKPTRPRVDADTGPANRKVNETVGKLEDLAKKRPQPRIDVDKTQADTKVRDLVGKLDDVGRMNKVPRITVETGNSVSSANAVASAIAALRDKSVTVTTTYVTRHAGREDASPTASGGTFYGPSYRLIGEAGPEAVVPLARNLSQVDPSVRMLSAIAQGKMMPGVGQPSKMVSADNWTIVSNSKDPETVAHEVFNRLAGAGY